MQIHTCSYNFNQKFMCCCFHFRCVAISTLHTNGVPSLSSTGVSTVGMFLFQLVWLPLETTFKSLHCLQVF